MKNLTMLSLMIVTLLSCSSKKEASDAALEKNQEEAFVHFYKVQSFCSCLGHGYENKEILALMKKEDLLGSYDQLANPVIYRHIDSLAGQIARSVKPETYEDFDGKKRIMNSCLNFYSSGKLDSIAHTEYESYIKK